MVGGRVMAQPGTTVARHRTADSTNTSSNSSSSSNNNNIASSSNNNIGPS